MTLIHNSMIVSVVLYCVHLVLIKLFIFFYSFLFLLAFAFYL